ILTNIEILNLTAVPKSLLIIGAGAVGVEFASIFRRFGSEVTIIEMLPRLVPIEDEDVSKELERNFKKQKIRIETGARAENIQKTGSGVKLALTTKDGKQETLEAEKLLVAVGRKPGHYSGTSRRFHQGGRRRRVWRDSGCAHHWSGSLRAYWRSGRGHGSGGHGGGDDADHPRAPHALRGHGRGFQRGIRSFHQ